MGITVGAAKVRLEFDTAKAKAQLDQIKAELERDKAKAASLAKVNPNSFEFKHLRNVLLDEDFKDKLRSRSQAHYGYKKALQDKANRIGVGMALGAVRHPIQTAQNALAGSTALQGMAGGAAVYGIARTATTGIYLTMEALKAAMPEILKDNPVFAAVQTQIEEVSKAMDNFESRIMSVFKAFSTTKDVAFAAARLTGKMPELGAYWDRAQMMAVQERDLALAFDRFKNKDIASGVGAKVRELTAESMADIFGGSAGK